MSTKESTKDYCFLESEPIRGKKIGRTFRSDFISTNIMVQIGLDFTDLYILPRT